MYDMHKELNEFYDDHVRLKDERKKLEEHRDLNIVRLKDGLQELKYPNAFEYKDQGSFAMKTINKHPLKTYDLDEAIIFRKDDLPSDPCDARRRIEEAMILAGGNFSTPPEAKTNAVRVSYAEGHHIDFAVYRKYVDVSGNKIIEHAGPQWTNRDPVGISNWFNSSVQSKSPSKIFGAQVDDNQLRRVVRWSKMFAKSRSTWELPGGLVISALAVEQYVANTYRDDSALYDTIVGIRNRLTGNKEINNPDEVNQSLTSRDKDKVRVKNLEEKLSFAIEKMEPLFRSNCTRRDALQAWSEVFYHSYWSAKLDAEPKSAVVKKDGPITVRPLGPYWKK